MHGTTLTRGEVQAWADRLADMPMEERVRLPGLQPHRADIVVHGICILLSAMERLGWEQVTVSGDIRQSGRVSQAEISAPGRDLRVRARCLPVPFIKESTEKREISLPFRQGMRYNRRSGLYYFFHRLERRIVRKKAILACMLVSVHAADRLRPR